VYVAEAGSAWTLLSPAYSVAMPQPDVLAILLAYAMARGDLELINVINTWIELKKRDRTIMALYDYWILGKNAVPPPRWSVIRTSIAMSQRTPAAYTRRLERSLYHFLTLEKKQ
jgi:hypothetical protein